MIKKNWVSGWSENHSRKQGVSYARIKSILRESEPIFVFILQTKQFGCKTLLKNKIT